MSKISTEALALQVQAKSGSDFEESLIFASGRRQEALALCGLSDSDDELWGNPRALHAREWWVPVARFCAALAMCAGVSEQRASAMLADVPLAAGFRISGMDLRFVATKEALVPLLAAAFPALGAVGAQRLATSLGFAPEGTEQRPIGDAVAPPSIDQVRRSGGGTYAESSAVTDEMIGRGGVTAKLSVLEVAQALTPPQPTAYEEDEGFVAAVRLVRRLSGEGE